MIIDLKIGVKMFYGVNLFLKSEISGEPDSNALLEEQILLISALSEEEAIKKASKQCNKSHSYKVSSGKTVTWSLYKIDRAYLIDELKDGAELFSRFITKKEVTSLLKPFDE